MTAAGRRKLPAARPPTAEKSVGSLSLLALLGWVLVVVFLWFGAMKFTAYEANASLRSSPAANAAPYLGRRTTLTFPLFPPPQKN